MEPKTIKSNVKEEEKNRKWRFTKRIRD